MGKWQPIETAPKDGGRVLLWWADGGCAVIGYWGPKYSTYGVNFGDGWGTGPNWMDHRLANPTHWMPLPPGP